MKNKCKMSKHLTRQRNLLHNHPLLSKGDVHNKSNKSKRRDEKMKIKKEWLPQNIFTKVNFEEAFLVDSFC